MRIISTLLTALLLSACSTDDNTSIQPEESIITGFQSDETLLVEGVSRKYDLYIPDTYINSPIVMLFHGHSSNKEELMENTPYKVWLEIAEQENIILVIPNGYFTSENEKGWNDCRSDATTNSEEDDVLFISNLLDNIISRYEANSKKVFTVGTSNGGHFSIRLAMEIPERLTAFAAIVSANSANSECSNSTIPVSALFMNGTEDPFLPYSGGQMIDNRGEVLSTENTMDYWITRNGTSSTPEIINKANIASNDNSTVSTYHFKNGTNNSEVILFRIAGGGHTEPSKAIRYSPPIVPNVLGNQNGDIEMAEEIWNFFKDKIK